jgi:hypothetical protein
MPVHNPPITHAAVTFGDHVDHLLILTGQVLTVPVVDKNKFYGGPTADPAAVAEFRTLVAGDIPNNHVAVTVTAPIGMTGQALSLLNDSAGTITEIDTGALANSDTVVPTSKAVTTAIAAAGGHNPVTVSAPLAKDAGQALSMVNDVAAAITEVDTGALANSDTVIPTSKAVTTALAAVSPLVWSLVTGATNAVKNNGYLCNTTGGAFELTLPGAPSAGDTIGIADGAGTFDTLNLTVGRNALNIMGVAENMIVAEKNVAFSLVYASAALGWRIAT